MKIIILSYQCQKIIDQIKKKSKSKAEKKKILKEKFIDELNKIEFVSFENGKSNDKKKDKKETSFIKNKNVDSAESEEKVKEITKNLNDLYGSGFKIGRGFVSINLASIKLDIGYGSIIKLINDSMNLYNEIKRLNAFERKVKRMEVFQNTLLRFYKLSTDQFFKEKSVGIEVHLVKDNVTGFEIIPVLILDLLN